MVKLNKIYTKTGDKGTTGLASGDRVAKHNIRIASYGTVDETNAALGLAIIALEPSDEKYDDLKAMILRIQNDLFDLGADLATPEIPGAPEPEYPPLRITAEQVTRLENEIDQLNEELEPLRSFVLPGGTTLAAYLHLARTVSRRAERLMVELSETENEIVSTEALQYINRLSDLLFVMSRYVNDKGKTDILWTPGQNRS
ncbi:MAG: cob(I)yrinic acid a,c-diamide adenosyltransferase [Hyphomicrobiales bacterium]